VRLSFDNLKKGQLGLSVAWSEFCAEAAHCCPEVNRHSTPVVFTLSGDTLNSQHAAEETELLKNQLTLQGLAASLRTASDFHSDGE